MKRLPMFSKICPWFMLELPKTGLMLDYWFLHQSSAANRAGIQQIEAGGEEKDQ
jgi:hypothetical protein